MQVLISGQIAPHEHEVHLLVVDRGELRHGLPSEPLMTKAFCPVGTSVNPPALIDRPPTSEPAVAKGAWEWVALGSVTAECRRWGSG
jgi:hypothetical protein